MTIQDKLTIERALGLIEGVAYGCKEPLQTGLYTAVEMISEVIDRESEVQGE